MCFSVPKPPPVPKEDPSIVEQREAAKEQAMAEKTSEKEARIRDAQMRTAGMGFRTLLTGSRGGMGYGRGLLG